MISASCRICPKYVYLPNEIVDMVLSVVSMNETLREQHALLILATRGKYCLLCVKVKVNQTDARMRSKYLHISNPVLSYSLPAEVLLR